MCARANACANRRSANRGSQADCCATHSSTANGSARIVIILRRVECCIVKRIVIECCVIERRADCQIQRSADAG